MKTHLWDVRTHDIVDEGFYLLVRVSEFVNGILNLVGLWLALHRTVNPWMMVKRRRMKEGEEEEEERRSSFFFRSVFHLFFPFHASSTVRATKGLCTRRNVPTVVFARCTGVGAIKFSQAYLATKKMEMEDTYEQKRYPLSLCRTGQSAR